MKPDFEEGREYGVSFEEGLDLSRESQDIVSFCVYRAFLFFSFCEGERERDCHGVEVYAYII